MRGGSNNPPPFSRLRVCRNPPWRVHGLGYRIRPWEAQDLRNPPRRARDLRYGGGWGATQIPIFAKVLKIRKFCEIYQKSRNFVKFPEFCKFPGNSAFLRNRGPFFAHAPKRCYYKAKWEAFLVIFARIAFFAKRQEFRKIPRISLNFQEFPEI